jgi:hypothetical protein
LKHGTKRGRFAAILFAGKVGGEWSFAPGKLVRQQGGADRFAHAALPTEGKVDFRFIW